MTTPQDGASKYKATDDGVEATIGINVDEKSISNLQQMTKATQAFRIEMEATARSEGKHSEYLKGLPSIAATATQAVKAYSDQLTRAVDLQAKFGAGAGGGGGGIPGITPVVPPDPFGGQQLGRGDMAGAVGGLDSKTQARAGAARGLGDGSSQLSEDQIAQLVQKYNNENKQAHGSGKGSTPAGSRPGEDSGGNRIEGLETQALKGRDLLGKIMSETGSGSSLGDLGSVGRDVLGSLGDSGGLGGMLGGAAKFLGPAGAAVGVGLAANQIVQMVGQQIQGYRAEGSQRGGGFSEGMAQENKARMLALDPFISTAQAREVIQGAMSEGYQGDSFDTVTKFLASNLKDMNMSVGDSVKTLRSNVVEGGESIGQLSKELGNLKEMAKGGVMGLPQLQQGFEQISGGLASGGAGSSTGAIATQFLGAFQNSKILSDAGVSQQAVGAALSSPAFQVRLMQQTGLKGLPATAVAKLGRSGQLFGASMEVFKKAAQEVQGIQDPDARVQRFMSNIAALTQGAMQLDVPQAQAFMDELLGGDPTAAGNAALTADLAPEDRSTGDIVKQSASNIAGGSLDQVANAAKGVGNIAKDLVTLNWGNFGADTAAVMKRKEDIVNSAGDNTGRYSNKALDAITAGRDPSTVQVIGADGKTSTLDQDNKAQRDALAAGTATWKYAGEDGPGHNLTQGAPQSTAVNVQASPLQVSYSGPISGPSSVQLSTNTQQSNQAYNGATRNQPPPGDPGGRR